MLTRGQVARRLGRSISTVRRLEGTELRPRLGPRGVRLFDEAEVEALAGRVRTSGTVTDCFRDRDSSAEPNESDTEALELYVEELERRIAEIKAKQLSPDQALDLVERLQEADIEELQEMCLRLMQGPRGAELEEVARRLDRSFEQLRNRPRDVALQLALGISV